MTAEAASLASRHDNAQSRRPQLLEIVNAENDIDAVSMPCIFGGASQATRKVFSNKIRTTEMTNIKNSNRDSDSITEVKHSPPNSLSDILPCLATQNPRAKSSEESWVWEVREELFCVCCEALWWISDFGLVVETSFFGWPRREYLYARLEAPAENDWRCARPKRDRFIYPCITWISMSLL